MADDPREDKKQQDKQKEEGTPQPPPVPAKPAAEPPKVEAKAPAAPPAPPKPPAGPAPEPWNSKLATSLQERFPEASIEALSYLGQNFFVLPPESFLPMAGYLKSESGFDMLADLTAVDYPKREKRFEVIYQLYSFPRNERIRLKISLGEEESVESATPLWSAANWLEREVFDMFGIRFANHPNLKRILLPEEWQGHPLRKDYGLTQQDVKWVQENLHIESGQ
ncbi:MAG: NADH-quinone oxidoreductase subunit C [Acidobacteria bacterium]|nr:NADH-quinone oxidoreductase subunit C [Acidobacteriota bacterium]